MAITTINDSWEGQPRREIETILKNELRGLKSTDTKLQTQIDLLSESGVASTSELTKVIMGTTKIAFRRTCNPDGSPGDGAPLAVGIDKWAQYARWGNLAAGILVLVDGGAPILVGLQQEDLPWAALDYQNFGTADLPLLRSRSEISKDMEGEKRTAVILANEKENFGNAPFEDYAAGWCSAYSTYDMREGKWWQPSIGELMSIWRHVDAINICIDVINAALHDGEPPAEKIGMSYYQSSSEYSKTLIWAMEMSAGFAFPASKNGKQASKVLPVSSLEVFLG